MSQDKIELPAPVAARYREVLPAIPGACTAKRGLWLYVGAADALQLLGNVPRHIEAEALYSADQVRELLAQHAQPAPVKAAVETLRRCAGRVVCAYCLGDPMAFDGVRQCCERGKEFDRLRLHTPGRS